jgi:thioredoxin reductase (NADPH)
MSDISNILVYSKNNCVYCDKAKLLLKNLGLNYNEKKFEDFISTEALYEDIGKNVRSMPQIKINGELIGGYNQLVEYLHDKGLVDFEGKVTRLKT